MERHERYMRIEEARRALAEAVIVDELTEDFHRLSRYRDAETAGPSIQNIAHDLVKRLAAEGVIL